MPRPRPSHRFGPVCECCRGRRPTEARGRLPRRGGSRAGRFPAVRHDGGVWIRVEDLERLAGCSNGTLGRAVARGEVEVRTILYLRRTCLAFAESPRPPALDRRTARPPARRAGGFVISDNALARPPTLDHVVSPPLPVSTPGRRRQLTAASARSQWEVTAASVQVRAGFPRSPRDPRTLIRSERSSVRPDRRLRQRPSPARTGERSFCTGAEQVRMTPVPHPSTRLRGLEPGGTAPP